MPRHVLGVILSRQNRTTIRVKAQMAGLWIARLWIEVSYNANVNTAKELIEVRVPLSGTTDITRSGPAELPASVGVFLTLDDQDLVPQLDVLEKFRKAIGNLSDTLDRPDPAGRRVRIRPTLPEIFRFGIAQDLK